MWKVIKKLYERVVNWWKVDEDMKKDGRNDKDTNACEGETS